MSLDRSYQADVIVMGGGIAGIVTALELLEHGKSVLVLDRDMEESFGGQAITAFGGGVNGKSSLEGTFISSCILSGCIAARSIAGVPNP